ncbi:MAG: bifunctional histidinol-phosphatase/imidazoleglycerol-phosphate dehydratase HisB [Bacteroidetes bacterium]|nr:MAG: bifunctional histidinol-phosphatase/imidazoleglycerol-phosphate dehydratase HisB [Bacteroidota bacterium]
MKKVLFIDRDGTLVVEPPIDKQLDSLEKLEFYPGALRWLSAIAEELEYELVMVTNQDGLGTSSFPEDTFWPAQDKIIQTFKGEGVSFDEVLIDRSFPEDQAPTRKPKTGLLNAYIYGEYDLSKSYVIGDRYTDLQLAKNLGSRAILIGSDESAEADLVTTSWREIYHYLKKIPRSAKVSRRTAETHIDLSLNLDGSGKSKINTGIAFYDHMLEQVAKHGVMDIDLQCKGDLEVDEHHTIEDVALALGEAFNRALGQKKGIERYGFTLPMDDCLATVAVDFGGRPWLVWKAEFKREFVGKMPTEMFYHFFKSFSDTAKCNLNIEAIGENEHHKIESIFKAFAKAIKMAKTVDSNLGIPSTKGQL